MCFESPILQHVGRLQRFHNHRLVFVNELSGKFVLIVCASVGNLFMTLRHDLSCFRSIGTAFFLATAVNIESQGIIELQAAGHVVTACGGLRQSRSDRVAA